MHPPSSNRSLLAGRNPASAIHQKTPTPKYPMNTNKGAKSVPQNQMVGAAGLPSAMPECASRLKCLLAKLAPAFKPMAFGWVLIPPPVCRNGGGFWRAEIMPAATFFQWSGRRDCLRPCQSALRDWNAWSGRRDSNPRPPRPERGALPDCATPRHRWSDPDATGHTGSIP
jgi:hypothetical protein